MLSHKKHTKRKNSRNNKKTKKRNNFKTKNRKYSQNTKSKTKTLIGGAGQYPHQFTGYTYENTLGTTGSGGASETHFRVPVAVAVSAADNRIYVADSMNNRVQVFDGTTRNYIATLGTTGSKGASNTQFNGPSGVAVSAADNRIYVVDSGNHRVQVFDATRNYQYIATLGTTGSAGASKTQFNRPSGVAVSAADNRIYVVDQGNHRVQVFDGPTSNYGLIATLGITGSAGASDTQFNYPMNVAISATGNRIYVTDGMINHRVQVFDGTTGNYGFIATLGTTGSPGASNTQFNSPWGVAVSAADNRIYVVDTGNHRVQVFDGTHNYEFIATLGTPGSAGRDNTEFNGPTGVAISADGIHIYVADFSNNRVQVFVKTELPQYTIFNNTRNSPPEYSLNPQRLRSESPPPEYQ